jgi:hypothetical protein
VLDSENMLSAASTFGDSRKLALLGTLALLLRR